MKNYLATKFDKIYRQHPSAGSFRTSAAGAVTLLILVVLCGTSIYGIMAAPPAFAYTISLQTNDSFSLDVSNIGNGAAVNTDTIKVTSTCPAGYTLSISGPDNTTLYKDGNSADESNYISASTGTTEKPLSITGNNINTWGYSAAPNTTSSSASFIGLVSGATVLATGGQTSNEGVSVPVYYGASVSSDRAPGTYTMPNDSAVIYTLTTDISCTSYQIQFNANGGTGTMDNQRISEDESADLDPNIFTKDDYAFVGWNTKADGTGIAYSNGQEVINLASAGDIVPLYAQWDRSLQGMEFSECTATPITRYDARDSQAYSAARLADGNCWILTNLKFDGYDGTGKIKIALTSNNSNVAYTDEDNFALPDSGTSGFDEEDPSSYTTPALYAGDKNASRTDDSSGVTNDLGVFYNYCAASAGTYCLDAEDESEDDAVYDVCPAGWRLGTKKEYDTLIDGYKSDNIAFSNAFQLIRSGWFTSSLNFQGSYGWIWTSTYDNTGSMYMLWTTRTSIFGTGSSSRYLGLPVRCLKENHSLHNKVVAMNKGTQSAADLQAKITKSNSGVYEYDADTFGAASDASNEYPIYYYRGILDSNLDGTSNTYGSNGNGATWPNYVKLNNTCWRIVRTTGSGGVKMIYNGYYSTGTTAKSCANATYNAGYLSKAFDITADSGGKSIVGLGYTYNSAYTTATDATPAGTLFGTNSDYSNNNTNSTMKTFLENSWFRYVSKYESILEPSAGYCNDRSVNSGTSWTAPSDTTSITTPYSTESSGITTFYFGARLRNVSTYQTPSLTCPRGDVDLYTTSSAPNGNKQLSSPVALLTADEASFAGSGSSTAKNGSAYHYNSFLRSGQYFPLFSPHIRSSSGTVSEFLVSSEGNIDYYSSASSAFVVRPVITLAHDTLIASGIGTATDPWVINAP